MPTCVTRAQHVGDPRVPVALHRSGVGDRPHEGQTAIYYFPVLPVMAGFAALAHTSVARLAGAFMI